MKALGEIPPTIRIFASFNATDARDRATWIPVIAAATHRSASDILTELGRSEAPPQSASVTLRGTHAVVTPSHTGQQLDRDALLNLLAGDARVIDAPFTTLQPAIRDPAARSAASMPCVARA